MWSNGSRKDFLSSYKWLRAGTEDGNWVFLSASCRPHAKPALRLTARRLPAALLLAVPGRAEEVGSAALYVLCVAIHLYPNTLTITPGEQRWGAGGTGRAQS